MKCKNCENKNNFKHIIWLLISIILISITLSIIVVNSIFNPAIVDDINRHKNSDKCFEEFDIYKDYSECEAFVCESINMTPSNLQSWHDAEVHCSPQSGGYITMDVCSVKTEACNELCEDRWNLQNCLYEWW